MYYSVEFKVLYNPCLYFEAETVKYNQRMQMEQILAYKLQGWYYQHSEKSNILS